MIDNQKKIAIKALFQEGMSKSEISNRLNVDRKSVRKIIKDEPSEKKEKESEEVEVDNQLENLFSDCKGRAERIHEKLITQGHKIGYSTITRKIRELGLRDSIKKRAERPLTYPGDEIQHDTSPYKIKIGEKIIKIQASQIYFRYSKVRYVKFYPYFNRFMMKCFFHEALMHFGYTCKFCIIDNTNLAIYKGTGKNAIFNVEMIEFAKTYKFQWLAHEIKHSDRKAGVERAFWTLETNFFPGREFESFYDINQQVLDWCLSRNSNPNKKTKIVPNEMFNEEISKLELVYKGIPEPYESFTRQVDQYGYIAFEGNFFWIPKEVHGKVLIIRYSKSISVFQFNKELIKYPLPAVELKGNIIHPPNLPPARRPKKAAINCNIIENELNAICEESKIFIEEAKKILPINQKLKFVRDLFQFYKSMSKSLFMETIQKAISHKIYDIKRLEKITYVILGNKENKKIELSDLPKNNSEEYLEGEIVQLPDLSIYDKLYGGSSE